MFDSIFNSAGTTTETLNVTAFIIIILVSLILGLVLSLCQRVNSRTSSSFAISLVLLPSIVAVVIMMVNGNIGAGIAVAGSFSLVRFRSIAGSAKDIITVFLGMASGLIMGMGYVALAVVFTLIACLALVILNCIKYGEPEDECVKTLRITIPESLDYTGIFDDIFETYTDEHKLVSVKTSNMGSLYRLTYDITLKNEDLEKEMMDKIRVKNGNLEIGISIKEPDVQTVL